MLDGALPRDLAAIKSVKSAVLRKGVGGTITEFR